MSAGWVYEIRIAGQLSEQWSDWLAGMQVTPCPGGETRLRGVLPDQAALLGVLNQLQALNLAVVSVLRLPAPPRHREPRR